MTRRISLPGADELFRSTGSDTGTDEFAAPPPLRPAPDLAREASGETTGRADGGDAVAGSEPAERVLEAETDETTFLPRRTGLRQRSRPVGDRRPTGRERHEDKITVYVSASELMDLEQARLTLRGEYGLAVDRGRIVREALAVVLADLEAKGDASILVRRLLGR
ncbi:MAG: hypothetical protein M3N21_01155 [Actinomycetota bacterium]|nr:hypothetical protein [Actinomycetota bacterium]